MKRKTVILAPLFLMLVSAPAAYASVFKVGTGTGCTHSSIQNAVNAANANPGVDHIIITRSLSYTAQAVKIQQAQPLTVSGGYAACADTSPSGARTTVSGAGGSADSVFTVEPGSAEILFEDLMISNGDDSDIHYGGGIDFTGSGVFSLVNVTLNNNTAGYGGGLSARGTGPDAAVIFSGEVIINNNLATQDGGGVHLRGEVTLYALEPKTAIWSNRATGLANTPPGTYHGYGGGMAVLSPARAYIGSTGYAPIGAIYANTARAGGGVAALADSFSPTRGGAGLVNLFTTDPAKPQKVQDNRATDAGGAFYVDSAGSGYGNILIWDTNLENNSAPVGSIGYLASNSGYLQINKSFSLYYPRPQASAPCNPGIVCSVARNNRSTDAMGNPTNGALIHGSEDATVRIGSYRFTENSGRSLLDLASAYRAELDNILIDNNTFTAAVLQFPEDDPEVELNHLTIVDNTIGGPGVIAHRGHVELNRSIIWQPGKAVRDTAASSGTFDGDYVLANETTSIPGVSNLFYPFDPGFINPTLKDYRLRAGSEAVDVLAFNSELDGTLDLDRLPRSVNLPLVPGGGIVDLGAYERQSIDNIMVNDSFNSDLSQWTLPYPALVSREANNGSGPSGSGSLRVNGFLSGGAANVTVAKQCQVLPGPGLYQVTGWGRSPGAGGITPGDGLRVHWKVFVPSFPAYGCTGIVLGEGDVTLPATSSWLLSPTPGRFSISTDDYLDNAAVEISLVARDVGVPDAQGFRDYNVAFDGITLEADNDVIFADGFD